LADLNTLTLNAGHWISEKVLVPESLIQILVIGSTLLLAWAIARPVRDHHRQLMEKRGRILVPGTLRNAVNVLILPVIWLVFLAVGMLIAENAGWPRAILLIAVSLLAAWVVIRFTATLFRNPFLTKTVALGAWTIAALNIVGLLNPILRVLDQIAFHVGNINLSVLTLVKGLVYLAVFLWIANIVSRFVEDRLHGSSSLTPSVAVLTGKIFRIVLITAAFLIAISTVGIDLTIFAVFGGALGVGLGFGLQKVVSNFISGIILLLDKSIKPGDVISIGTTYGWVKSLNARYVSLDTRDGVEHLIPNEDLIVQRVENWSYSHNRIRLKVPVGIHYKSNVRKVIELCLEAADEVERVLKDPEPTCPLKGFGDNSVDLEIRFWIQDPQLGISNVKSEILLKVWDKFHEHDIEIPYPQRDIHIKTPLSFDMENTDPDG
jgi:small-conductance mechanosensitive channel